MINSPDFSISLLNETRYLEKMTASKAIMECENKDYDWIRAAGFWHLAIFIATHNPGMFTLPPAPFHDKYYQAIPRGKRKVKFNALGSRNCGKSKIIIEWYILHSIYYKSLYLHLGLMADHDILIVGRSEKVATDRLSNIRMEIEDKFPDFIGRYWQVKESHTANDTRMRIVGRGGKVRGSTFGNWRLTFLGGDDIDDIEAQMNPEVSEKDYNWFNSDIIELGDSEYTNCVNCDTVKGRESISVRLGKSTLWDSVETPAIITPRNLVHPEYEELWEEYRKVFVDRMRDKSERKAAANLFYEENKAQMDSNVTCNWKERWSYKYVRELSFDRGNANVLRELQCVADISSDKIFDMQSATYFEVIEKGLKRTDGRIVEWTDLSGASIYLDWAGQKDREENCYAAAVAVAFEPLKRQGKYIEDEDNMKCYAYVLSAWMDRGNRDYQLRGLVGEYQKARKILSAVPNVKFNIYSEGFIDKTGDIQDNFNRHYRTIAKELNIDLPLLYSLPNRKKFERIEAMEAPIKNGWIAFNEDLIEEFIEQLDHFGSERLVDAPDALEGAWSHPILKTPEDKRKSERRINELANISKQQSSVWNDSKTIQLGTLR